MSNKINYKLIMAWLGNEGTGTSGYKHYKRDFVVVGEGKPPISGSSDVHFWVILKNIILKKCC